jgi:alkylation response protein AidB-like acyl-CoA dehydrogenase
MVQFLIEAKSNALMSARGRIAALNTERPGAIAMSGKLRSTELKRRFCQFALSLQGANGARFISPEAVDGGKWQRIYFNSFSATIGGGTSQVQYNIMGERVLGLPKS